MVLSYFVVSKENEVGRACGTHGRGEKRVQGFGGKARRKKDHLKDQSVDGRIVSKWTSGRLVGGVWSEFTWLRIGTVGGLL
jgi:hypothetical protein